MMGITTKGSCVQQRHLAGHQFREPVQDKFIVLHPTSLLLQITVYKSPILLFMQVFFV